MTAREMHYDFKQKLNKLDSQKNRNLNVPEIDWKLNEAQEVFVKMVAQPKLGKRLGFEFNQRTIDDIRTIVVNQTPTDALVLTSLDNSSFTTALPNNYWFFINADVLATKKACSNIKIPIREVEHDDEAELSPFDRSSFEWRRVNIRFNSTGIKAFSDGTFTVNKIRLDYIKRPRLIHNAQDYVGGTYKSMDGATLTGTQSSELPDGTHREIVDLAVLITAGDLDLRTYQIKQNKLNLTS